MAQLDSDPFPDVEFFNNDQWDGYPLARTGFTPRPAAGIQNAVVPGDNHAAWAAESEGRFR